VDERTALQKHYASLADDELRFIATTRELTALARSILEQELRRRGINDLTEYKQQLDGEEAARREALKQTLVKKEKANRLYARIGYTICLLMFLAGAARWYFEGNEKDGIGMMLAAGLVLPAVWGAFYIRRLIWRFTLRP
jgi:hypothetical protein